ncbi:hypothetical protein F2Q69_00018880 [Brassica cretica]|uniref:SURP motif domain-containing protein n=1 Tax=Brassica cretica TaxID=69181 RepID=A0A8S9Q596_BRACR|nr:hypothetical protein F2Q69_00018880 [Brassica cretica]
MFTTQPEKTSFIEEVARLVSQKSLEIEKTLVALNKDNGKKFSFLLRSDPCHAYYQHKLDYYRKEAQVTRPHAPATTNHDCSVADGERLTAQFIARYDTHFLRALKEHVAQNPKPQFEFLKPTSSRFNFCRGLVRVLTSSECWTGHPDMPQCLQFFFHRLQLEKLEAGDKMAMIDLHAFVSGVDLFAERDNHAFGTMMSSTPHLSKMMYEWPQMQPSKLINNTQASPSSSTDVTRRRERANAFCEAIRALDATDLSQTSVREYLIPAIQNLLKDPDALDPAHKEALEITMKERSGGTLEAFSKAMGAHLGIASSVTSLFGEGGLLGKKEATETTPVAPPSPTLQGPDSPKAVAAAPIEDNRFKRIMRGNFTEMLRSKPKNPDETPPQNH